MENEIKNLLKKAICEEVKKIDWEKLEEEQKNAPEIKKLDSEIEYLKTIDNVFNHKIKICGIK